MTIFQEMGRLPGYPQCGDSFNGTDYVATYKDKWKLLLKPEYETMLGEDILNALPTDYQIGAFLGNFCQLRGRNLKRDDKARLLYHLDLDYSTDVSGGGGSGAGGGIAVSPDQRPARVNWDFEQYSAVIRKDADTGISVVNSVGEPFEVLAEIALPILTVERFQAYFDPDAIINYVNYRNNSNFWGAAAGVAVCVGIRDREGETYQGFTYRNVSYTFKFFVPYITNVIEGATEIVLDCGHRYRPTAGAALVDARTLVNLNSNGTKVADGSSANYLRFQKHPLANFNDLGVNIYQI